MRLTSPSQFTALLSSSASFSLLSVTVSFVVSVFVIDSVSSSISMSLETTVNPVGGKENSRFTAVSAAFSCLPISASTRPIRLSIPLISVSTSSSLMPVCCMISILVSPFLISISISTSPVRTRRLFSIEVIRAICSGVTPPSISMRSSSLLLNPSIFPLCLVTSRSNSIRISISLVALACSISLMRSFTTANIWSCSCSALAIASKFPCSAITSDSASRSSAISRPFRAWACAPSRLAISKLILSRATSSP